MSKIKYLVFFCLLILLCLGLAATGSAREQPADMIIVASDHHGDDDDDFISKKEAAKELKPGIDSKVKVNVKKDDEQDEDKEDEKEHRDKKESVKERVYGDGQKHDEDREDMKEEEGKKQSLNENVYGDGQNYDKDDGQKHDETDLKVFIKGKKLALDVPPVIKNGRTLIPVRAVTEGMGATVGWDETTGTITIVKDGVTVTLTIGSNTVDVSGQTKTLDVPAQLQNSRTLVPLRFIGEAFKSDVQWYPDRQMVVVN